MGGYVFLSQNPQFLELGDIKNFGGTRVLSGPSRPHFGRLSADYRPISAENSHLKLQKYGIFEHFRAISETFFFQNKNFDQNCPKMIKNGSYELL